MRTLELEIEGIAPFRFNRMSDEARDAFYSGKNLGRAPMLDELKAKSEGKLFKNEHGELYIPSKMLKAAIRNAGSLVKVGRKSCSSWFKAVIFPEHEQMLLGKKKADGIHEDLVRRPPIKGTIQRDWWPYVAAGYRVTCRFLITDESLPISALEQACHLAGLRYGLGDGRPDFGRFEVKRFELVESNGSQKKK